MAGIGCFHRDTELLPALKEIMRILAAHAIQNDLQFTVSAAFGYLRRSGVEVDLETVAAVYEDTFDLNDGNFNSQEQLDDIVGRSFENSLNNLQDMAVLSGEQRIGILSPGKQVAKTLTDMFQKANVLDIRTRSTMKEFERLLEKAARAVIDRTALPTKSRTLKTFQEIVSEAFDIDNHGVRTISGSINSARQVWDEFRKEVEKYREELADSGNEAITEQFEKFTDAIVRKGYSLLLSQQEIKSVVNGALIDAGFSREITRNGEKVKILDWKKLMDASGSFSYLEDNVSRVFSDLGYTQNEINRINDALKDEYIRLRAKIITKKADELARKAQSAKTALSNRNKISRNKQQANSERLAKLYTLGLFDATPDTYENVLNSVFGMSDIDASSFQQLRTLAQSLHTLYSVKIGDTALDDVFFKTAINSINEQIGQVLRENQNDNSRLLKIARTIQSVIDASFRFILTGIKNMGVQNPLSGYEARLTAGIQDQVQGNSTPELKEQNRKLMSAIFKDMALNGGMHYGDVNTTFVNRGRLDELVNKLSDNQLYHAIVGTLIGRTGLAAMDSRFKSGITEKYLIHNLIKILTQPRQSGKKDGAGKSILLPALSKEEAIKYISENITGTKYEDSRTMATDVINTINRDAGKKILSDHPLFITRLANDIVKGQLLTGGQITQDQVLAAYNSAYRAAGRDLGHVANNFISRGINGISNSIQTNIDKNVSKKHYNAATMLTGTQVMFRNFMNPFIGGATNWIVLKAEKSGLGLITGLGSWIYNQGATIDMTTDAGMKQLSEQLYNEQKAWNKIYRGAVGAVTSAIMYGIIWGTLKAAFGGDDDKERRRKFNQWRSKNYWASKYTDEFSPEWILAQMAVENDKLSNYVDYTMGWNDNYSSIAHIRNGLKYRDKGNDKRAAGEFGQAVGSKLNFPLPGWRLTNDLVELYQGFTGTLPPYHYRPTKTAAQGFFKNGFFDKMGITDELGITPKEHKK